MPRMMRRMMIVLSWATGLMVALLIALVVTVLVIDPDSYRPRAERELTQLLGREVSAEHLSVAFSLVPALSVQGLRIANPPWASRPQMLLAKDVELSLDLIELFFGRIEIGSVTVQGLDLLLEQGNDGVGNWVFPALSARADSPDNAERAGAVKLPDFDAISLRDADIAWRGATGDPIDVRIASADAVLRSDIPFELKTDLTYRQVPITAELRARDTLQNVLNGHPLSASIVLRSAETRVDLEVDTPDLFNLGAVSVNFAGQGKRLDALSALAGRSLPAWGPYGLSGTTTFANDRVQLGNLRVFVEGLAAPPSLPISRLQIDSGEALIGREVPTSLRLQGKLDEANFRLDVTSADVARLVAGGEGIPLVAKIMLDDFEFGAEGAISLPAESVSFNLATYVKGDVRIPARLVGAVPFSRALRVDLSGRIEGDAAQISATGVRGTIAQCTVAGDLTLQRDTPLHLRGALDLGRLDLAAFEVVSDKAQPTPKRQPQTGPPEWLNSFGVDLRLQVGDIVGLPVTASSLSAHGILDGGRLEVRKFRGTLANTLVLADAGLQWKGKRPYVDAKISLPLLDISNVGGDSGEQNEKTNGNEARLNAPLPLAPLRTLDADLTLEIGRIDSLPVSVNSLRSAAQLTAGVLRVPLLNVTVAGVASQSTVMLDARRDEAHLTATTSAAQVDVANLLEQLKLDTPLVGTIGAAAATVNTRGASLRAWVANAKVAARVKESTFKQPDDDKALIVERASAIAGPDVNVRAELRGQYREFPLDLILTGGRLAELLDGKPVWPKISAALRTTFQEQSVRVTAQSALEPLASGKDVPVRVEAYMQGARIIATGTISDIKNPERTPLDAKVTVDSLARLPFTLKDTPLPDIPFSATAKVAADENAISLDGLVVRSGQSDLAGEIRLAYKDRIKLSADLSGKMLDLRPYMPVTAAQAGAATASSTAPNVDQPFDLKGFRHLDADLRLRAQRLVSHRLDLDDVRLKTVLDGGLLKISAAIAEGNSQVEFGFDARGDVPAVATTVSVKKLNLETLKSADKALAQSDFPLLTLNAQLAGTGTTPRQIYTSAKGYAVASTGPGRIGTSAKPFAAQVVTANLLEILVPGRKPDDYSQLECGAARFELKDGIASSPDGIALRFKRMDILGSGAINLTTREILFGFKAVRRRWFSFSILSLAGDFASVTGTIDKPRVGLDKEGALFKGGTALATAGVSLLATGFLRTLSSSDDPCAAIVEKGRTATNPIDSIMKNLRLPRSQ